MEIYTITYRIDTPTSFGQIVNRAFLTVGIYVPDFKSYKMIYILNYIR